MNFEESLNRFLQQISRVHTGSKDTQDAYHRDVERFLDYLKERKIDSFEHVTKMDISDYLTRLKEGEIGGTPLSNSSYARNLSSIKSFYRYLNRFEKIQANPVRIFKGSISHRKLPEYLTFDQMETILSQYDLQDPVQVRNRCMIEVMYACGLRVSECASVKISNINLQEGYLTVLGKESKERMIPFYPRCKQLIEYYLSFARPNFIQEENDILFVNQKGKPISSRSIQNICEKAGEDGGLTIHIHPHMIRHSFATHMLDNGADLRIVQELLGHENLGTTQIYTHVTQDKLRKVVDKAHPHAKKVG